MKNIIITGISKGLGLEIAKNLLQDGYCVYGINRTVSGELFELKNRYQNQLFIKEFDLSHSETIKEKLFGNFLNLDIPIYAFINNAAIAYDDLITNINLGLLDKMYRVNVLSPVMMTKYVIRNMLYHRIMGKVIHISSISVHTGYKGLSMYASSKGAIEAFSKNTAREWGSRGICSNCIVAGFMETDMSIGLTKEQKDRIYKRTSLKKPTDKLCVVKTVKFLLNNDSITGQNIFVDSGTI
jgi:3-oxoacyl-[acyl-carrier protein] reductase